MRAVASGRNKIGARLIGIIGFALWFSEADVMIITDPPLLLLFRPMIDLAFNRLIDRLPLDHGPPPPMCSTLVRAAVRMLFDRRKNGVG